MKQGTEQENETATIAGLAIGESYRVPLGHHQDLDDTGVELAIWSTRVHFSKGK